MAPASQGRARWNPWAIPQPSSLSRSTWRGSSTPSATSASRSASPWRTTVRASSPLELGSPSSATSGPSDLEDVDGKAPQVGKRGVAGADIVDGHVDAGSLEGVGRP